MFIPFISSFNSPFFKKFPMISLATFSCLVLLYFCTYSVQTWDILILHVLQFSLFHHITSTLVIHSHQILYFAYYWCLKSGLGLILSFFLFLFFKYSFFNQLHVASPPICSVTPLNRPWVILLS